MLMSPNVHSHFLSDSRFLATFPEPRDPIERSRLGHTSIPSRSLSQGKKLAVCLPTDVIVDITGAIWLFFFAAPHALFRPAEKGKWKNAIREAYGHATTERHLAATCLVQVPCGTDSRKTREKLLGQGRFRNGSWSKSQM